MKGISSSFMETFSNAHLLNKYLLRISYVSNTSLSNDNSLSNIYNFIIIPIKTPDECFTILTNWL